MKKKKVMQYMEMRKDFINKGKTESSYLVEFDYAQNFLQFQN